MRKLVIAVVFGLSAFALYALAVLSLPNMHKSTWRLEQSGPIPIAASFVYYGKRLGVIDGGLWDYIFPRLLANQEEYLDSVLDRASRRETMTKPDLPTSIDGSGFGYARFAVPTLFLFGPRSLSLVIGFLAVMCFSTVTYLLRFRDGRLLVVPIIYCAQTLLLLTPFATDQVNINQAPIGGYRFFVVAGILPAVHVILELFDRTRLSKRHAILLILQLSVIFLVASVRLGAAYFFLAATAAAIFALAAVPRRQAAIKLAVLLLAGGVIYGVGRTTIPKDYLALGLTSDPPWHRAIVGLGVHPEWPFGDLSERVDCRPEIPRGLSRLSGDQNGHCFYVDAIRKGAPAVQVYSGEYERMMRQAFLGIIHDYPRQILETFLIYKPQLILNTLSSAKLVGSDRLVVSAVSAQVLILLLSIWILGTAHQAMVAGAFALTAAMSAIPQEVAWSSLHTAPDLICYKFIVPLLLVVALTGLVRTKVVATQK